MIEKTDESLIISNPYYKAIMPLNGSGMITGLSIDDGPVFTRWIGFNEYFDYGKTKKHDSGELIDEHEKDKSKEQKKVFDFENHYGQRRLENVKLTVNDNTIISQGKPISKFGKSGVMRFKNEFTFFKDRPYFLLSVLRTYLEKVDCVVDDSICFILNPESVTRYAAHSPERIYYIQDDRNYWKLVNECRDMKCYKDVFREQPICTRKRKIRVHMKNRGWADLSNERDCGLGIILLRYSPAGEGLFRVTHPQVAPDNYSEIEFQWLPKGKRPKGLIEKGLFAIYPHVSNWRLTERMFYQLIQGINTPDYRIWEVWDKKRTEYVLKHNYGSPKGERFLRKIEPNRNIHRMVHASKLLDGRSVLDVGCGMGHLYNNLKKKKVHYTGLDSSLEMLKIAKKYFPKIKFQKADIFNLPNKKYDTVYCIAVLTHLPAIVHPLRQLWGCTKKRLVISLPLKEKREILTEESIWKKWHKKKIDEYINRKKVVILRRETKQSIREILERSLDNIKKIDIQEIDELESYIIIDKK